MSGSEYHLTGTVVGFINSSGKRSALFRIKVQDLENPDDPRLIFPDGHAMVALYNHLRKVDSGKWPKVPKTPKQGPKTQRKLTAFLDFINQRRERLATDQTLHRFLQTSSSVVPDDYVWISINKGRNLTPKDGKDSDPFVKLSCYDGNHKSIGSVLVSEVKKDTVNPTWENEEHIIAPSSAAEGISVSVWDKDMSRNDFMGRFNIPLSAIPSNKVVSHWFGVHQTENSLSRLLHGEIHVSLLRVDSSADEEEEEEETEQEKKLNLKRAQMRKEERKIMREDEEDLFPAGEITYKYLYNPPAGEFEGYLTIKVIKCIGLVTSNEKLPDPFVRLSFCNMVSSSDTKKDTASPVFNETFYFFVAPHAESHKVHLDVMDQNVTKAANMCGETLLRLGDLQPNIWTEETRKLIAPHELELELHLGKQPIGRVMASEGFVPNLPVLIVPGFGSSGLEVVEGYEDWEGTRVWLSIRHIGRGTVSKIRRKVLKDAGAGMLDKFQSKFMARTTEHAAEFLERTKEGRDACTKDGAAGLDIDWDNVWGIHMALQEDGLSDPPGVKVRSVKGDEAVTYLDPGMLTSFVSYVMGPLVENLQSLGYTKKNLKTMPYDWRVCPEGLENRDQYFTRLKAAFDTLKKDNGKKVVVVAHSMGNNMMQYFLNWAEDKHGRDWIDDTIHTWVAVGPPWLGAPKTVRCICTGDRFGMDMLMGQGDATYFARVISSVPFLWPKKMDLYAKNPLGSFIYEDGEARDFKEFFSELGADCSLKMNDEYYGKNPYTGGGEEGTDALLKAPPINNLWAIYGINLDTEYAFCYSKKGQTAVFDENAKEAQYPGYRLKNGILYETGSTPQPVIERYWKEEGNEGAPDGDDLKRSGDGTVPYVSLSYCKQWKDDIPNLKVDEIDNAEHRATVANKQFMEKLFTFICDNVGTGTTFKSSTGGTHTTFGTHHHHAHIEDEEDD